MRTAVAAVAISLLIGVSNAAADVDTNGNGKASVNIPAERLDMALRMLAKQTGLHLVFISEDVSRLSTQGVQGNLTFDQVLGKILSGTGLTFQFLDERTVGIGPDNRQNDKQGSKMKQQSTILPAVAGLCGSLLAANPAICQEAAAQSAAVGQLEEIIVTAERRQASLQETPVSVTALQGDELTQRGRASIAQILSDVPSVSMPSTTAAPASAADSPAVGIAIRGLKSNGTSGNPAPMVAATAYYVDGVLDGIAGDTDINQVQVLRGPQGTLYGRSATAGAVLVATRNPSTDAWGADASVEFGNYGRRRYSAAANLPLGDTVALRLSGTHSERDGYYAPEGERIETKAGRAKLLWAPSSDFSVLLGIAGQESEQGSGELLGRMTGLGTGDVVYDQRVPLGNISAEWQQYWAEVNWDFGPATLTYMPALRKFENSVKTFTTAGGGTVLTGTTTTPEDPFHTQELRVTSNSEGPWSWQTGVFYYNNELISNYTNIATTPTIPPPGRYLSAALPQSRDTTNIGVYGESTYSFASNTELTAGLRYDYTSTQTYGDYCAGLVAAPVCVAISSQQGKRIWRDWTYKLRLTQHLTPDSLVFASVSTAFLPGDLGIVVNENDAPVPSPYEAETLTSFEVGSKNRFMNDRLQVNGGLYYYRYGGHQLRVSLGLIGGIQGNPNYYAVLGAPARMWGSELELLFQATENDRFGLNASYTDAWFLEEKKSAAFANGVANEEMSGIIPLQVTPSYQRIFQLPGNQTLTFNAQAQFRSSHLISNLTRQALLAGREPFVTNGDSWQGNVYLNWEFLDQTSLSIYVQNVTDDVYKTNATSNLPAVTSNSGSLSEPRTYGVVLNTRF